MQFHCANTFCVVTTATVVFAKATFLIACIRFLVTRANSRAKLFYRLVFLDQAEHFWPGDSLVSLFSKSIRQRNIRSLVSRQVFFKYGALVAVTRRLRGHITSGSPLWRICVCTFVHSVREYVQCCNGLFPTAVYTHMWDTQRRQIKSSWTVSWKRERKKSLFPYVRSVFRRFNLACLLKYLKRNSS